MVFQLLMIVENSLRLPGLGTLAVSRRHATGLRRLPLHANLEVELRFPGGTTLTVPATVEELQRPADAPDAPEPAEYVLLLESDAVAELPAGTGIWLSEVWADIYHL